jgi:hypothetical protein
MCEHSFVNTGHSRVCTKCGVERSYLRLDAWNKYSAPLERNYDRCNRFKTKVEKLLGSHRGPVYTDKIWGVLKAQEETLHCPGDVRNALRNSKLRAKHYDCVRIFCDVFTNFKVTPYNSLHVENYLLVVFRKVHQLWVRKNFSSDSFFSYEFLIRFFLEQIESPLLVYLKPRSNKRRVARYVRLLDTIQFQNDCKSYYRNSGAARFRNVSSSGDFHQSSQS